MTDPNYLSANDWRSADFRYVRRLGRHALAWEALRFLRDYRTAYAADPRSAALEFGMRWPIHPDVRGDRLPAGFAFGYFTGDAVLDAALRDRARQAAAMVGRPQPALDPTRPHAPQVKAFKRALSRAADLQATWDIEAGKEPLQQPKGVRRSDPMLQVQVLYALHAGARMREIADKWFDGHEGNARRKVAEARALWSRIAPRSA